MYFHLVCSPEFFAVASSRKSARKLFRRSLKLMVLKDNAHKTKSPAPFLFFEPTQRWLQAIQCAPKVYLRKLGQNGQTPEARTRSLWGFQPRTKAICKVETTKTIVDGLIDFYNLVFYFI